LDFTAALIDLTHQLRIFMANGEPKAFNLSFFFFFSLLTLVMSHSNVNLKERVLSIKTMLLVAYLLLLHES